MKRSIPFICLSAISALLMLYVVGCKSANPKHISNLAGSRPNNPYTDETDSFGFVVPETRFESLGRIHPDGGSRGDSGESLGRKELGSRSPLPLDSTGDELWVIYKPDNLQPGPEDAQYPATGSLMTRFHEREVPLPLKHTDVKANVTAYIASVTVTQQFENPYDEKIEAIYVFPLPENGAVNEFIMTIGQRHIRGIVRERKEAERIYKEAKAQGYVASLMTQERPNIFTQSVANIEPGKQIDITIRYYNTLSYSDGWYEFVFPMVVGPRFNPPGNYKGIGSVDSNPLSSSRQKTDVHYLRPDERSGHDISLQLTLNPGVDIEEFQCKTHQIRLNDAGNTSDHKEWVTPDSFKSEHPSTLSVRLASTDTIPNRDFVFRYRVAGNSIKSSLMTHQDERGGFFTMMVYPPAQLEALDRSPLELVFVLDCSGSMSGEPLRQAKAAIAWALKHMDSGDTFQLINFSDSAQQLGRRPIAATRSNVVRALNYLNSLQSEGGTMMIEGIKSALDFPHDPDRLRFVCFLTDGYIGNESEILQEIHHRLGDSRIFSFGVGSAVNRFLLDGMAKVGHGAVAYLGLHDDGAEVMENFFQRISHPALTNVKINWGQFDVTDVYPRHLPDIFPGKPLIVTGRYESHPSRSGQAIQISGKSAREKIQLVVNPFHSLSQDATEALPSVWARFKIADLLERSRYEPSPLVAGQVRQTALDYQLLSPYTAFIAMDAARQTKGASATIIPVAVPVPEGVKYETTVNE